jgi:hypothetical protein
MVQHVEHHHACERFVAEWKPMSIGYDVDPRKQQDVGRDDIGPEFLDASRAAADVENATFRAAPKELPVKIPIQQTYRFLFFPPSAVDNLTLVQIIRAPWYGKTRDQMALSLR